LPLRRCGQERSAGVAGLDAKAPQFDGHPPRQVPVRRHQGHLPRLRFRIVPLRGLLGGKTHGDRDGDGLLALVGRLDQFDAIKGACHVIGPVRVPGPGGRRIGRHQGG
jgi:hypothetical protein